MMRSVHFVIVFILLVLTGCGSLAADYVAADEETYNYAQPKLEEWAKMKGDPEWEGIVRDKGASWKARIERQKRHLEKE